MHAGELLRKVLVQSELVGHATRREALLKPVEALVRGTALSVTTLGRAISGEAYEKHRIKRVDVLLSNDLLYAERFGIYRELSRRIIGGAHRPLISVDWSDIGRKDTPILRASLSLRGRGFVLWEQTYSQREYNTAKAHTQFMKDLHSIVPEHCTPVIITDAGFRAPWFRTVESLGWMWLGRVRNNGTCRALSSDDEWLKTRALYDRATDKAQDLGLMHLNQDAPLPTRLVLSAKPQPKRRGARRNAEHYRQSKSYREPWLLAASPALKASVTRIMKMYDTRMQIEESFRDLKSPRFGFGMRYSNSTKPRRVDILLLIATLATFALWLSGLAAEINKWRGKIQACTRKRRTLSVVFVGARVFASSRFILTEKLLRQALNDLQQLIVQAPKQA